MNKKGFTLIELLAVIIILSLLVLLTSTAITKIVKDSKQELSDDQIASIKAAAEIWGADNIDELPITGSCSYLTLRDLKEFGLIDSNIIDPKTNERFLDSLLIKLTTTTTSYGVSVTNYEVNPDSVEGCIHATGQITVTAATAQTVTTGYVPEGNFEAGDEYIIHIGGEDRIFFILGENAKDSNNVDLIMNKNIGSTVAWCDDATLCKTNNNWDNTKGPITANAYLKSQTSNWEIIPTLPKKDQITQANNGSTTDLPIWIYDYTDNASHSVTGLLGYWTVSVYDENSFDAWSVNSVGGFHIYFIYFGDRYGVRPVITLPKTLLD